MCQRMEMPRDRKPIHLTLDPKLVTDLDAWIEAQELKTTRTAVVELAIKEFLKMRKL